MRETDGGLGSGPPDRLSSVAERLFGGAQGVFQCPYPASSSAASLAMTSTGSSCAVIIPKFMRPGSMTSRHCASACATCAKKGAHGRAKGGVKRAERGSREDEA